MMSRGHFDGLRDDCDDIAKELYLLDKLSDIAEIADFLEGCGSCAVASCS